MASGGDGDLCTVTAAIVGVGNFAIGVTPHASPAVATGGNGAEGANGSANRIEGSFHCADGTDDDVSAAVDCGGGGSIGDGGSVGGGGGIGGGSIGIGSQAVVGGCGVAAGEGSTFGGSGGGSEGGFSESGRPAGGGSEGRPVGDLSCSELCERRSWVE